MEENNVVITVVVIVQVLALINAHDVKVNYISKITNA